MKEVHLFVHCVIMWNNARWLGKKNNETCSVEQKYFLCRSGFLSIAIFSIVLTVLKNHFGSNATPYRNFASLPTAGLEKHKLQLNIKYAASWFIFWNYLFILNIFTFNLYTTGLQKKTTIVIHTKVDFAIFGLYLSTPFVDRLRFGIKMMLKHASDMYPYLIVFT